MGELKKSEDVPETMDVTAEDENVPLPWHHVASFAIYKLFSQWEEDPNLVGVCNSLYCTKLNIGLYYILLQFYYIYVASRQLWRLTVLQLIFMQGVTTKT